jgi:putative oxidoreductase
MVDRWFVHGSRYAPVLIRLIVGVVGVLHGWPKLKDLTSFIENVRGLGIPLPELFATAAALSEFLGGLALIIGFCTRYAAFFFACTMAVAVFRVHWAAGFFAKDSGYEYPLTLLVAALSLMLSGSGPISFDSLLGRKK